MGEYPNYPSEYEAFLVSEVSDPGLIEENPYIALVDKSFIDYQGIPDILLEKGDWLSEEQKQGYWEMFYDAVDKRREGKLLESYDDFIEIYDQGYEVIPNHLLWRVLSNLYNISKESFHSQTATKEDKVWWANEAYARFTEYTSIVRQESPQEKLWLRISIARLKDKHADLLDDNEEKKEILQEAYDSLVPVQDIALASEQSPAAAYYIILSRITSKFHHLLTHDDPERSTWVERTNHAGLSLLSLTESTDVFVEPIIMTNVVSGLSEIESNVSAKKNYLDYLYRWETDITNERIQYENMLKESHDSNDKSKLTLLYLKSLDAAIPMILNIVKLEEQDQDKAEWLEYAYELSKSRISVAIDIRSKKEVMEYYQHLFRAAENLEELSYPSSEYWREQQYKARLGYITCLYGFASQEENSNKKKEFFDIVTKDIVFFGNMLMNIEGDNEFEKGFDLFIQSAETAEEEGKYSLATKVYEVISSTFIKVLIIKCFLREGANICVWLVTHTR